MAEEAVLSWLNSQNRPFSVTNAVDALQTTGYKKSQVSSALASLAESGRCSVLVNGKQSVYYARQDTLPQPSPEELKAQDAACAALKQQLASAKSRAAAAAAELRSLGATATAAEMAAEAASLGAECGALEGRLLALRAAQPARAGPPPSAEQRAEQERLAEAAFEVWRSRRSKAKSALGGLAEMQERREKAVAEDAGYEGDDGEEWRQADELVKALKKRRGPPPRGGAGAQPAARG